MYFKTSLSYTGPKKYILRSAGTDSVWGFYSTEEKKKKSQDQLKWVCLFENTGLNSVKLLCLLNQQST